MNPLNKEVKLHPHNYLSPGNSNSKLNLRDVYFQSLDQEFNRFFDDFFAVNRKQLSQGFPKVDIYEHHGKFVIEFSLAGVDPSEISIELLDSDQEKYGSDYNKLLKVSGKMSNEFEHKTGAHYHVKELTRKNFSRSILLRSDYASDPEATYHNGMLTLSWDLPKTEDKVAVSKSIPIQVKRSQEVK